MTAAERVFYDRVRRRALNVQPELARRLLASYDLIRTYLTEAELAKWIASGQVDALIDTMLSDDALDPAFRPLRALVDRTVLDAARQSAADMPKGLGVRFDTLNPQVLALARTLDTRVADTLSAEVRATVRQHVVAGIEAGANPRTVARGVRKVIGLSPSRERAVANFRAQLETGDRAALGRVLGRGVIRTPDGTEIERSAHAGAKGLGKRDLTALEKDLGTKPLRADQIERMTDAYRKRLLALEAETQTRTMALDAQRAGQRASWEDAATQGVVDRSRLRRVWVATDDERTRPEHAALDGTEVGWDERYPNGEMVPGESTFNCRCVERVVIGAAS